jgi:hypothetical protein
MSRLFAALYVSEMWHSHWRSNGSLYAKARCMTLFDRVLSGEEHRMQLNGLPLDSIIEGAQASPTASTSGMGGEHE